NRRVYAPAEERAACRARCGPARDADEARRELAVRVLWAQRRRTVLDGGDGPAAAVAVASDRVRAVRVRGRLSSVGYRGFTRPSRPSRHRATCTARCGA